MKWSEAVTAVREHVVMIRTPRGSGTGFLVSTGANLYAIATAAHVIDDSVYWDEPIEIHHPATDAECRVTAKQRVVRIERAFDTASILIMKDELALPENNLPMAQEGLYLAPGEELGWLGFPCVVDEMCFFKGVVSAWDTQRQLYFVDGVAINGVSGGPGFVITHSTSEAVLMGVVTDYIPNLSSGASLPGLSVLRDVKQFQEQALQFQDLDEAAAATPSPPPPRSVLDDSGD